MLSPKSVVREFVADIFIDPKKSDKKLQKILPELISGVKNTVCKPGKDDLEALKNALDQFESRWGRQASEKLSTGWKSQAETMKAWIADPAAFCEDPQKTEELRDAALAVSNAWKEHMDTVSSAKTATPDEDEEETETTEEGLSEKDFQNELMGMLSEADFKGHKVKRVSTFEEAGIMTRNKGVIVRLDDNTKFQIEIVKDRRGY